MRWFVFKHLAARIAIFTAMLLPAASALFAQLATARLGSIYPPGGKAGSTVEVMVAGVDLDEASQLHFSQAVLSAKPKLKPDGQPELNKFIITIPADAPPGVCDARVIGRFGISNPRAFVISDRMEVLAPSTNTTSSAAMELPLNSVASGRVAANGQAWFKFAVRKGQRVLIDCQARAIDSRMEDVLTLQDAFGNELSRSRHGGLLDFTAPEAGEFKLKLHDLIYRGGDDFFFRLAVQTSPWIDFIHPSAGVAGTKGKFTIYGRNLPGGSPAPGIGVDGKPLEKLEVEIQVPGLGAEHRLQTSVLARPADAALDGFDYRLKSPQGVSNPFRLGFAGAPVIAGPLDMETVTKPEKVTVPCEYAGKFHPRGVATVLLFDARKGDVYWLEVFSQRLGFAADPFLLIERVTKNDKGEEGYAQVAELYDSDTNLGGTEYNTATRDPVYRLEVKDDGQYRVQVRDLFNRSAAAPRHSYRLAIRKETPDFRLVAMAVQPPKVNNDSRIAYTWTPLLRRNETQVIRVVAFRRDGFNGEITLTAEGLPAGVTAAPAKIEAGKNTATLALSAASDVKSWGGAIKINGRSKLGDQEVLREARSGSVVWHVQDFNNEAVQARLCRDLALGVCGSEQAALSLQPVDKNTFEVVAGGKVQIPIRLNRHTEFLEALKLKAVGVGALDSLPELEITTKTNLATLEIDLAKQKVPAGTHSFYLQAQTKGKYRSYASEAQATEGDAARADKEAASAATAAKKAADALATANKALIDAEAQLKSAKDEDKEALAIQQKAATEAKASAEKSASEADAKAKAAEKKKSDAQARLKEMSAKSAKKDATIMVYSAPITLHVKAEEKK